MPRWQRVKSNFYSKCDANAVSEIAVTFAVCLIDFRFKYWFLQITRRKKRFAALKNIEAWGWGHHHNAVQRVQWYDARASRESVDEKRSIYAHKKPGAYVERGTTLLYPDGFRERNRVLDWDVTPKAKKEGLGRGGLRRSEELHEAQQIPRGGVGEHS
jgi:hypothetical protein